MAHTKGTKGARYEAVFHLTAEGGEEGARSAALLVREAIEKRSGTVVQEGTVEHKTLAYPIVKKHGGKTVRYDESYFSWIAWTSAPEAVLHIKDDIARVPGIIRYAVVSAEEHVAPVRRIPPPVLEGMIPSDAPKEAVVKSSTHDVEEIDREIEKLVFE